MGQLLAEALLAADPCTAASADRLVPRSPGYYAIFVDDPDALGQSFGGLLRLRQTPLIYVGIATGSLRKRLVEQDLRHRNPSTFFRGLGAVLGYRPLDGSLAGMKNKNNYRFSAPDTRAIIMWIDEHLSVSWIVASPAEKDVERAAIGWLRPLLNTDGNPDVPAELGRLREECRRIARSGGCG